MGLNVLWYLLAVMVVCYLLVVLWMSLGQSRRLFKPLREIIDTPDAHGYDYEDVTFASSDGVTLHGWYVPHRDATHCVLFFHGNTRNISHCIHTIDLFQELGFSTLLFDYRGYGRSSGTPDEQGIYDDAAAAWRYLVETRGMRPDRIVLHGRSLGAAIASWLAAHQAPAALVIESTFTSLPDVAAELYPMLPARLLARHKFPVREHLQRVQCPLLVVHGMEDELIPYRHGRALFDLAPEPREFLDIEGRHFDGYLASGRHYYEGLAGFFARHLKQNSPQ